MDRESIHDQNCLREEAYADDAHLDVRYRTHQRYTVDPVDFGRWTLERLVWQGEERVLDVGCARGDLLRGLASTHSGWGALVGFDLSPGMISQAVELAGNLPVHFFVGDAQSLPCPSGSFDVVMARHMLYHVPDIDLAIAEGARLLRPGGRFLVITNSAHTMPEYHALSKRAATRHPAMNQVERAAARFSLENAVNFLEPHFDQIQVHTLSGTLRFPTAQPFLDYFASGRALIMRPGHTDAQWEQVYEFVRTEVEAIIIREGRFDVTKISGAVVGVKPT
jgi:ubiquinone/menaquinone biosynthesis C-methylase UbiE